MIHALSNSIQNIQVVIAINSFLCPCKKKEKGKKKKSYVIVRLFSKENILWPNLKTHLNLNNVKLFLQKLQNNKLQYL